VTDELTDLTQKSEVKKYYQVGTSKNTRLQAVVRERKDPEEFSKHCGASRRKLLKWKEQEKDLIALPLDVLKNTMSLQKQYTGLGKFPDIEKNLLGEVKDRRFDGESVSKEWLKARMKFLSMQSPPENSDPAKDLFGDHWAQEFFERWGLSM